jgi:FkbM family methyltransferase
MNDSHPLVITAPRVFLDVGAHYGETLDVVLDPRWAFSRVVCFEPSSSCLRVLGGFRDPRLEVVQAGLSNTSRAAPLFGAGTLGASIYSDKPVDAGARKVVETINLLRASDWIRTNTTSDDTVYLKLNCEGSECDVLEDVLSSDVCTRIAAIYVDFDVRKIPSQAHREASVREALACAGVPYITAAELGYNANPAVQEWLSRILRAKMPITSAARLRFALRLHRSPYAQATALARRILPRRAFHLLALIFGNHRRLHTR